MVVDVEVEQVLAGDVRRQLADLVDVRLLLDTRAVVVPVQVVAHDVHALVPAADSVHIDDRNEFEHEVLPQLFSVLVLEFQQFLHKPQKRPLASQFPWMDPCTNQTILFIFEHMRLIIFVFILGIELFSFVTYLLIVRDRNALDIPSLLRLAQDLSVKVDIRMVGLG